MATLPKTSVSLIKALADDPQSARWDELYLRYEQPMRAFLQSKYPSLEPEDVIQETMVALSRRLPGYSYTPDVKGHFRNYLLGILDHKAADAVNARVRETNARRRLREDPAARHAGDAARAEEWKIAALEVAIEQLLADQSVNPFHRTVFRQLVQEKEKPDTVAARFGVPRNTVDQIKHRLVARLAEAVRRMTAAPQAD